MCELQPFGAGGSVGAAQPAREVHHQEHLVKYRPQPGYPDAFHAVGETEAYHPHGAADVEHIGGVAEAEHIPGQLFAAEHIALFI
jgi:hypothetical protein